MLVNSLPTIADLPAESRRVSAREALTNKGSAVYFLCRGDECVYVGQTRKLRSRLRSHATAIVFDDVYILDVQPHDLLKVERHWIRHLRPPLNRCGKTPPCATKNPRGKLGRPPKPPAERLRGSGGLNVPLTPAQRAAIDAAAGDEPVTAWARSVLLRAARRKT